MEWLTKDLTDVAKVRRNVILLAALAALLAVFPVQTNEVSLLGARFTSEVVAFGIFHALIFYTFTLGVRTMLHVTLTSIDRRKFQQDVRSHLQATLGQNPDQTPSTTSYIADIANTIYHYIDHTRDQIDRLEKESGRPLPETHPLRKRLDRARIDLARRIADDQTRSVLASHWTVQVVSMYVFVGEYLFPILAGTVAAGLLYLSQDFPMLWQLNLQSS